MTRVLCVFLGAFASLREKYIAAANQARSNLMGGGSFTAESQRQDANNAELPRPLRFSSTPMRLNSLSFIYQLLDPVSLRFTHRLRAL